MEIYQISDLGKERRRNPERVYGHPWGTYVSPTEYVKEMPQTTKFDWSRLPTDVILTIYLNLDKVDELWAMMCTCSPFWNVFFLFPHRIFNEVLTVDTHRLIRGVINVVFNLRAHDCGQLTYKKLRHIDQYSNFQLLSTKGSSWDIIRFISMARRNHALSHVILSNCMKNLWSVKDKIQFREPGATEHRADIESYVGTRANLSEESNAILCMWLIELHETLYDVAKDLPWVSKLLASVPPRMRHITDFFRRRWQGTMLTVWYGMQTMNFSSQEEICKHFRGTFEVPARFRLEKAPKGWLQKAFHCDLVRPGYSYDHYDNVHDFQYLWKRMRYLPTAWDYLVDQEALGFNDADLYRLPMFEYIPMGLLHWDTEKLIKLGLEEDIHYEREKTIDGMFQHWKSLLSPEVIAYHAEQQSERKDQFERHLDALYAVEQFAPNAAKLVAQDDWVMTDDEYGITDDEHDYS